MSSHTLTISGAENQVYATKSGVTLETPYTLQNGDVIRISCASKGVNINGVEYLNQEEEHNISISNQDIVVTQIDGIQKFDCIVNITYTA